MQTFNELKPAYFTVLYASLPVTSMMRRDDPLCHDFASMANVSMNQSSHSFF